jgi:predicted O-methyltransferase YrrM
MTNKSLQLTDALLDYLLDVAVDETDVQRRLREETARLSMARMQIAPEQGQFMGWLARLINVRRALEIGVFTGYSSLCVAYALPADGRLIACDMNEQWTDVARRYWREAGVADKIKLRLAPALNTLDQLLEAGHSGSFDYIFIDADKANYLNYYERGLQLLRPGGVLLADNVLWSGRVADPSQQDRNTSALRAFNAHLRSDRRIWLSMLPLADGLTLAMKKDEEQ